MKLIEVTCPKCGATMKVDQNKKEMNCEYCGNKFLIDDEVLKVKHINAGEIDEEQEFKNALTYLNFKEYVSAYNSYLSLSKRYVAMNVFISKFVLFNFVDNSFSLHIIIVLI